MSHVPSLTFLKHSSLLKQIGRPILGILVCSALLILLYQDSLGKLVHTWLFNDNYGHGLFVPFIAIYLIWGKKDQIQNLYGQGSWFGPLVILVGMTLQMLGKLSTLYIVEHFSLWVVIVGLVLSVIGLQGIRILAFPLGLLLMTIPLPQFLFQGLTTQLRLISSTLGVECLQIIGITAYQDGNVIDLGPIRLQVVEACSGLRFLFPLMTLSLLAAFFFKDRLWKRIVLFLSSIPIAIGLNGFRIGIIGILVEIAGQGAAEGFLHLFEGWVIFVFGLGILLVEMWILKHIFPLKTPTEPQPEPVLKMEAPFKTQEKKPIGGLKERSPSVMWKLVLSLAIILSLGLYSRELDASESLAPPRQTFLDFPMQLGRWRGTSHALDREFIDVLRFDDYLLVDYTKENSSTGSINLYVAYYRSQHSGQSIHSPKSCIPGGGWLIASHEVLTLDNPSSSPNHNPLRVNQILIKRGDVQQLVFYWFQQRQRQLTNEYLVKWYLLWDTLIQQRTDGALIRLTTPIPPNGNIQIPQKQLVEFAYLINDKLGPFIPH